MHSQISPISNSAELEKAGKLKGVVTQNIDGLHQKAGSKNVMELHGSVLRNYCERCGQFVSAEDILHSEGFRSVLSVVVR